MKNKLSDLNNHLFAQLERLSDEKLRGEKLSEEIVRAKAVSGIAQQIIANANTVLEAHKAIGDKIVQSLPEMMGIEHKK